MVQLNTEPLTEACAKSLLRESGDVGSLGREDQYKNTTMTDANRTFDTSFVLCVEAGPMETQAIMLVDSIRRWGGRFAKADIIAVQPRFGPRPSRETSEFFRKHDVNFVRVTPQHNASWDARLNKSTALAAIERQVGTETVTWLDTDILVFSEPEGLALAPDEDFAARPECHALATAGPEDQNEPYWLEICRSFGVDIETMGWVTSSPEGDRIRSYWQGGVYVYRRSTDLGQAHLDAYLHRLRTRIAHANAGIIFYDQTSMTMAVRLTKLRIRELPFNHNSNICRWVRSWATPEAVKAAKVVHYHDYFWPEHFADFETLLEPARPEVRDFVHSYGPLKVSMPPLGRAIRRVLNGYREYQRSTFQRTCKVV